MKETSVNYIVDDKYLYNKIEEEKHNIRKNIIANGWNELKFTKVDISDYDNKLKKVVIEYEYSYNKNKRMLLD